MVDEALQCAESIMSSSNVASSTDAKLPSQLYCERDITLRGKFSKSHLYNMVARGEFPRQVITQKRFARWGSDVDDWFADPAAWIKANSQGIQEKPSEVAA